MRYSEHFEENGDLVLRHACRLGLEGVVSKLRDAPYRSGRGKASTKSKCSNRQEFVVAGYVPSNVYSKAIGSLALGYFDGGTLIYAGRVGTGFSNKVAADLFCRLKRGTSPRARLRKSSQLKTPGALSSCARRSLRKSSFAAGPPTVWCAMRPSVALREDKRAEEVVLETRGIRPEHDLTLLEFLARRSRKFAHQRPAAGERVKLVSPSNRSVSCCASDHIALRENRDVMIFKRQQDLHQEHGSSFSSLSRADARAVRPMLHAAGQRRKGTWPGTG